MTLAESTRVRKTWNATRWVFLLVGIVVALFAVALLYWYYRDGRLGLEWPVVAVFGVVGIGFLYVALGATDRLVARLNSWFLHI